MATDLPTSDDLQNVPTTAADAKPSLSEAKQRFMEAMQDVDLLEPLRKHPYVVVGAAVTAGAVLGSSGKVVLGMSGLVTALTRMIKPLGGLVAQLAAAKLAAHTAVKETQENPPADPTVVESSGASI
jgi:hypothetical protein